MWLLLIACGGGSWLMMLIVERRTSLRKGESSASTKSHKQAAASTSFIDYNEYTLSPNEKGIAILMLAIPVFLIGYIFYQNIVLALLLSLTGFLNPSYRRKQLIQKRKQILYVQFKQALSCLSSSMTVGKSIETSFREAWEDLKLLYPDPASLIIVEFGLICRKVDHGEPIETALKHFADRSHLEDIQSFTDVFLTCKRTGGNLVEVMKRTAMVIAEKLEITQDISIMIAQKRFESRVLVVAPIAIVAVLAFTSPDYMVPLYHGGGILIMTVCLAVLGACYLLTQKIMNIKV